MKSQEIFIFGKIVKTKYLKEYLYRLIDFAIVYRLKYKFFFNPFKV